MTALKESLKNTEKLLDDALLTLESVTVVSVCIQFLEDFEHDFVYNLREAMTMKITRNRRVRNRNNNRL